MSASRRVVVLTHLVEGGVGVSDYVKEALAPIDRELRELFGLKPSETDFHLVEERARAGHASHDGVQQHLHGEQPAAEQGRDLVFRCHPFISGVLDVEKSDIDLYRSWRIPVVPRGAHPGAAA